MLRPTGSDPLPVFQKIIQVSDVKLRQSDYGLNTVLSDIPKTAHALGQALSVPTDINSLDISLDGTVGGKGFMRNPTSCGTKTTSFSADSYADPSQKVTGQATYTSVKLRRAAVLADSEGQVRRGRKDRSRKDHPGNHGDQPGRG